MKIKELLELAKQLDPESDARNLLYQTDTECMFEYSKKQPSLFIEFPTINYERLIVLNPSMINRDIKDALVRFVNGDEIADTMLKDRAVLDKIFNEDES